MKKLLAILLTVLMTASLLPAVALASGEDSVLDGMKAVFIHHSSGGMWLSDYHGKLGSALATEGLYLSDICYNWNAPYNTGIGNYTDIGNWYTWFADTSVQSNGEAKRDNIMNAVYARSGMDGAYGAYTRIADPDVSAENEIVIFKSCYPNSEIYVDAAGDPQTSAIFGKAANGRYTESNVRAVYNAILPYMLEHPEKLFVVVTAPPLISSANAARARSFNNWLVNDWLDGHENENVYVWDYYNVLTDADNHHNVVSGAVVHHTESDSGNTSASGYYTGAGDPHPSITGDLKATAEFVPCLEVFTQTWKDWLSATPTDRMTLSSAALSFGSECAGYSSIAAQTVTVRNTGNTVLSLSLSGADNYLTTPLTSSSLAAGESASFTVRPANNLSAGDYNASLTVTGGSVTKTLDLQFTVRQHSYSAQWTWDTNNHWHICSHCGSIADLSAHSFTQSGSHFSCACGYEYTEFVPYDSFVLNQTEADFGTVCEDYAAVAPATVTLTNNGNTTLAVSLQATGNLITTALSNANPDAGETATFTVRPADGLPVGTYTENVTLTAGEISENLTVQFTVRAHSYSAAWTYNTTEHWHTCTFCSATTDRAAHTYTATGNIYTCECGYSYNITEPTGNVFYVAADGDNNADGSSATPWQTLEYASTQATDVGDTIFLRPGSYSLSGRVYLAAGVSLMGAGADNTVVSFSKGDGAWGTYAAVNLISEADPDSKQTVSGIRFDGNALTGDGALRIENRNKVEVYDCKFINFRYFSIICNDTNSSVAVDENSPGSAYGLYIHDNILDSENNGSYSLPTGISLGGVTKSVLIENNSIRNATPALLIQPRIYGVCDVIFRYNACLGIRNVTGSGSSQGIIMRGAGMPAYNDPAPYVGWQAGDLMPVENLQIYGNILQSYYKTGANGCYGLLMDTDTSSCWKGENIVISDNLFANFSGGAAFISNFDEMDSLTVSGNRTDNCGQIWDGGAGQLTTPIRVSALGTQTNVTVSNNPTTGKTIGAVFTQHNDRVVLQVNNGSGVPSPCTAVVSQFLNGTLTDSRNVDVSFAADGSFGAIVDFSDSSENTYTYTVELIETPGIISVNGVVLDIHEATVAVGDTQQLTAIVSPNDATDTAVSFSSNNTAVAQVDSDGLVTAYAAGTATITVSTADGGFTDTCVITVPSAECLHTGCYTVNGNDATCTQDGYTTGTYCPDCGIWTEGHVLIPALNHKNAYTVEGTPASCTETGLSDGSYCPDCDTWRTSQTVVNALGHAWNDGEVTTAATCTQAGLKTFTCTRCGDTKTEIITAKGHTAVTDSAVAPTCTQAGLTEGSHCSECGEVITAQTVVPALGHNYTSAVTAPTCTAQGYTTHTCTRCGDSYTDTQVAALGHDYTSSVTAPTCTAQGYTTHTCTRCGDSYTDTQVAALGHNYTSVVIAPTCTAQGYTRHTCTRCSDSYTDTQVAALGHNYTSVVIAPTCTAQGYTRHTCTRCNNSYTSNATAALGHIDDNADGYCDLCDEDIRVEEPQPELSFFEKIAAFFQKIIDFFKNLFS